MELQKKREWVSEELKANLVRMKDVKTRSMGTSDVMRFAENGGGRCGGLDGEWGREVERVRRTDVGRTEEKEEDLTKLRVAEIAAHYEECRNF